MIYDGKRSGELKKFPLSVSQRKEDLSGISLGRLQNCTSPCAVSMLTTCACCWEGEEVKIDTRMKLPRYVGVDILWHYGTYSVLFHCRFGSGGKEGIGNYYRRSVGL